MKFFQGVFAVTEVTTINKTIESRQVVQPVSTVAPVHHCSEQCKKCTHDSCYFYIVSGDPQIPGVYATLFCVVVTIFEMDGNVGIIYCTLKNFKLKFKLLHGMTWILL